MRCVVVESPYAGDVRAHEAYARACLADCLKRGEAPFASHLLYTQPGVLDDNNPIERQVGILAGLCWSDLAAAAVVYVDHGLSKGMRQAICYHLSHGTPVEVRRLYSRERPGPSHLATKMSPHDRAWLESRGVS